MACPSDREREVLIAYCAARLPAEQAARVELHLRECPDCERFVREQSAVWNRLDEFSVPPMSESFDRALWERIESEERRRWWPMPIWKPVLSFALACLLVVAVMLIQGRVPQAVTEHAQAETVDAEHIERALEDMEMLRQFEVIDEGQAM